MDKIQQIFLAAVKEHVPADRTLVNFMTGLLPISKEAMYRRIRGDIPFTLEETISICKQLNISIDQIIENNKENTFKFRIDPVFSEFSMDEFYLMMKQMNQKIEKMRRRSDCTFYIAQNTIPLAFAFKYRMLTRIKLSKWSAQMTQGDHLTKISEMNIPEIVFDICNEYTKNTRSISMVLVLEERGIFNFIDDIKLFASLDILSPEDQAKAKEELLAMIDDMEQASEGSAIPSKNKIQIFISESMIDAAYTYAQNGLEKFCSILMHGLNHVTCYDGRMCYNQKIWIESLVRFSTLISGSGEVERFKYFKTQRELINQL